MSPPRTGRAFRWLLRLLPEGFRREETGNIEAILEEMRERRTREGGKNRLGFWLRAAADVVACAARERVGERTGAPGGLARGRGRWNPGPRLAQIPDDVRRALRALVREPGFGAMAIATLAIGIGANTAMFSAVNGVLLRPMPYEDPDDLVAIFTRFTPESGYDIAKYAVGSPEYFDYQRQNRTLEEIAAVSTETISITSGTGDPENVVGALVSPSMFAVLRTPPFLGRTLRPDDGGAQPSPVVVIGHGLWKRRFGGDPEIVGQSIEIGLSVETPAATAEVVGVMPPGFAFPRRTTELWGPLPLDPARTWRGGHWFWMIGRLAEGVDLTEARAEMETLMAAWAVEHPDHHVGHGLWMLPLIEEYVGEVRAALLFLLGAVGLVLLIACANVGGLLLSRAEARRREIAVRCALGAGRGRLVQQLLTEGLVLAALGGVAGLALARAGLRPLLSLWSGAIPRAEGIAVNMPALVFTGGLVIAATLVFGLVPAWHAASADIAGAFKEGGRGLSTARRRVRAQNALIVVEVAVAILLVIGAGLLVRSFVRVLSEDPGYRVGNLLAVQLSLPNAEYGLMEAVQFFDRVTEETRALPGVIAASVATRPPLVQDRSDGRFHIEHREVREGEERFTAGGVAVGDDLLSILEIPLIRGRLPGADDRPETEMVVVIDEEMARRYWPGQDPLGQRIRFGRTDGPMHRIVGIVGSAKFDRPTLRSPTYYFPYSQVPAWAGFLARDVWVLVRTQGEPRALLEPVRAVIRSVDPRLPVANVATLREIVERSVADRRFLMTLLAVFAGAALVLGAVGIFGVVAHAVSRRTREIGVRIAVGARGEDVVGMVVRQGMATVLWGVVAGIVAALAAGRVIAGFLYGVAASDPWTLTAVPAAVVVVAALAAWLPARRASRIDPMETLRAE